MMGLSPVLADNSLVGRPQEDEDDEILEWKVAATSRQMLAIWQHLNDEKQGRPAPSLTVDDLAQALGASKQRIYRWLNKGLVPGAFKLGPEKKAHWFIPADAPSRFRSQGTVR